MIKSRNSIQVDDCGKELSDERTPIFNLTVNDGDIHQFIASHIPSHWHRELEIFVLLSGCVQVGIGDCTYKLQEGEGCFINTEVLHSFTAQISSPCKYRSFVFGADIVGGAPGSIFDTAYVSSLLENGVAFLKFQKEAGDEKYFEQFDRAFTACIDEKYGYEFEVRDAFSNIILYIKSKTKIDFSRMIPSIQEARLKEMLIWISENLEKNISVSQIARTVNICPRECQRIFQQYLHYSPIEYIQRKRIFKAAGQLITTEIPVTEIALNCGFQSPSYFSKQFKAFMGSTPREYRCSARKKII